MANDRRRAFRRFTRCCWQLLIPAILGSCLGADGIGAAALCAAGPGLGRGMAREGRPDLWQAVAEALGAALLAALVASISALLGAWTVSGWASLTAYRGWLALHIGARPGRGLRPA